MKQILIITLLALAPALTTAQTYKPFRVELGAILGNSWDDAAKSGWGGYIEPRFAANDQWLFGFRFERTSLDGGSINIDFNDIELKNTNIRNRAFFAEYFFSNSRVRPFVGVSAGVYTRKAVGIQVGTSGISIGNLEESKSNFGFAPRVGINAGHFRVHATANFTGEDIADYLGFGFGFELGGGRRSKNKTQR